MKTIAWQKDAPWLRAKWEYHKDSWSCTHIVDDQKPTHTVCGWKIPKVGEEYVIKHLPSSPKNACNSCMVYYGRRAEAHIQYLKEQIARLRQCDTLLASSVDDEDTSRWDVAIPERSGSAYFDPVETSAPVEAPPVSPQAPDRL